MKMKTAVILTSILVLFLISTSSHAVTISIEENFHHIGDSTNPDSGFTIPLPEGTEWGKTFTLNETIEAARNAHIQFIGIHIDSVDIVINGNTIAVPVVQDVNGAFNPRTIVISVPISFFNVGENTIIFRSIAADGMNFDDLEFGEVLLHLN